MDLNNFEDMDEELDDDKSQTQTKIVFKDNIHKNNVDISEEELESLYLSFDIDFNQIHRKYSLWRLEVIHIRGVHNMSSEDVLKYFEDFDPNSIEWVNDLSCNVVFSDQKASAVAMKTLTTALVIKKSKQQLNCVIDIPVIDSDSLSVPIPPQFRWRLGKSDQKSKALLLRFATNNDRKVSGSRLISKYYAQNGFPNDTSYAIPTVDRKRRYISNQSKEDSVEEIKDNDFEEKSKGLRMRMRADDEQQLIHNRITAKMRTNTFKSKRPRKTIWDRLDNDSFGNYCAVDTDLLEIAFDSHSNSRTVVKERPLRSSITIVGTKNIGFAKNDLRTKLRKRKSY